MEVVNVVVTVLALVVLVPVLVLAVECLAAVLLGPTRAPALSEPPRSRCAVLMPAHDEELVLGDTLDALRPQLTPEDRLVVVADNCSDRTAEVARSRGADVLERHNREQRGKGYALAAGVEFLGSDPPPVVIVVDADCRLGPEAIARLGTRCAASGRPVQAVYTMEPPPRPTARDRLSALAFRFKNDVRPLGLHRLGIPCLLTGSGMAFPWEVIRRAPLASGNIVEDMQLGIDLALAGTPPEFLRDASVRGELPSGARAAGEQRRRWEHGHLHTLLTQVPRLLGQGLKQLRWDLLGLACELAVPPLSVLCLLGLLALAMTSLAAWYGASPWPMFLVLGGGGIALFAMALAWARFGRDLLPVASLPAIPLYILGKLPMYLAFLGKRQRRWVRTERAAPPPEAP